MILLYPSIETEFQNNGLGALPDAISCTVTEERNGMYELEMQYPVSGSHYGEIANRAILFCKPDPYRDPQPFRIYRILKPISGRFRREAARELWTASRPTQSRWICHFPSGRTRAHPAISPWRPPLPCVPFSAGRKEVFWMCMAANMSLTDGR